MRTLAPRSCAVTAVAAPAPPNPTTTMSASLSHSMFILDVLGIRRVDESIDSRLMKNGKSIVRVGTGVGFSDDRFEPARDLAERGAVDYLVFECLAERTIARETLSKLK